MLPNSHPHHLTIVSSVPTPCPPHHSPPQPKPGTPQPTPPSHKPAPPSPPPANPSSSPAAAPAHRASHCSAAESSLYSTPKPPSTRNIPAPVSVFPTDITQKEAIDTAFASFAAPAPIHVLVSNAATIGPQDPLASVDPTAFLTSIGTNIRGALLVAQAFLRHAAPDAVVVETNSSAAHVRFGPGFPAYSVAKMAMCRLWDGLGAANPGVRVFHVQPGVVDTDMNREAGGVEAMGFEDHVSLPAGFNLWLASDEARFLRGRFLWVNWDVEELKARAEEIEAGTQFSIGLVGWPFGEADWSLSWKSPDEE